MNRERLPSRRKSATYSMTLKVHETGFLWKIHVTLGRYEDGRLGEIFIDLGKTGSIIRMSLTAWAILASLALQSGVTAAEIAAGLRGLNGMEGVLRCDQSEALDGLEVSSPWDAVGRLIESEA